EQFVGRATSTRQLRLGDAPHVSNVPPRSRIVNGSIARELIGLLPVLATSLTVPLPSQRAESAERAADFAERQRNVDECEHSVDAGGVLLGSTGCEHHRRSRTPKQLCGL